MFEPILPAVEDQKNIYVAAIDSEHEGSSPRFPPKGGNSYIFG